MGKIQDFPMKVIEINSTGSRLITTKQACELWGISKWTLLEMVKRGEINRVMGLRFKEFRFRANAFEEYLRKVA